MRIDCKCQIKSDKLFKCQIILNENHCLHIDTRKKIIQRVSYLYIIIYRQNLQNDINNHLNTVLKSTKTQTSKGYHFCSTGPIFITISWVVIFKELLPSYGFAGTLVHIIHKLRSSNENAA